jgi:hypothetical protein
LDLVFDDAHAKLFLDAFERLQQRRAVKIVGPNLRPIQNLESHLMGGEMLSQCGFSAQDEQTRHSRHNPSLVTAG